MKTPNIKRGLSSLKKHSNLSKNQLSLFVLIFALIGGFILIRSFAQGPLVTSLEAEQMILPAGSSVLTDSTASGGKAVKLVSNGTATGSVNFPSSVNSLTVLAKGDQCSGAPTMTVALDGTNLLTNTTVSATSWTAYSFTTNSAWACGTHNLSISFNNAYSNTTYKGNSGKIRGTCTRALYLDVTNFYGPTVVTPAPTVTLSASPTSVTAGSASTLTWASTNATACSASGAWSGSEPTSGSVSTGAINQTSTYSLTCTGSGGSATASASVTVTSAVTSVRTNAGGSSYTDTSGNNWSTDCCNSGGNVVTTTHAIAGTSDQTLYQSQRWNTGTFTYTYSNLATGTYQVTLKFAEIASFAPGGRQFNVAINGNQVLTNFDIAAQVGQNTAIDKVFTASPSNGQIVVTFSQGAANNPVINAIGVTAGSSTSGGGGTTSGACVSGQCMPTGNITADGYTWNQKFTDEFDSTENLSLGSYCGDTAGFPHAANVTGKWNAYPWGWPGTPNWGKYCPERTTSIHDGVMDIYLHSEVINGTTTYLIDAPEPRFSPGSGNSQIYGRYVIRYQIPQAFHGYHASWLLWPDTNPAYCNGEMDFPEMDTNQSSTSGFVHYINETLCSQQDAYSTPVAAASGWHTAITEWSPTFVKYYLDGNLIGNETNTSVISNISEHYVIQNGGSFGSAATPTDQGHILIDWVTIYSKG